ncbi:hypothetical protein B5807_05475 [Epicoccum nigrum]|uniref:F-box domain-containing protein n=1 Tax=Epicoccum nigrum TaxID=105696 RepID=A0A1Y2M004_EPING|nr:hypothetical protein B5807_05475 [Epicoccum nigrum]
MEALPSDDAVARTEQSPSHTQPAPSQALVMDDDTKRMVEICTKLSPKNRSKMLSICEDLLVDAGLDRVGCYISRYVPPIRHFRFINLPLELRLIVARYALTADDPLDLKWLQYLPTKKLGTFKKLDQLTTLTRASKNIYNETLDLVWRLNSFDFRYESNDGAMKEKIGVFLYHMRNKSIPRIPIQVDQYVFIAGHDGCEDLFRIENLIAPLSLLEPRVQWRICDWLWVIPIKEAGFAADYMNFAENAKERE